MTPNEELDIKLLLCYPLISKVVKNNSLVYKGIIEINGEDYKIAIQENDQNNFILKLPSEMKNLQEEFQKMNHERTNIISYLDSLRKFISLKIPPNKQKNNADIYKQVLNEYAEFTKFYLNIKSCYLAYDLSKISVVTSDELNREHTLQININYNDKNIFEIVEYDLPIENDKFQKSSSLKLVYNQFTDLIERLQPFFNLMEYLDKNCDILDPVPSFRRYKYRRIWLGDTLSIVITVDPFIVNKMPTITFLGPERMVESYRTTMNNNLEDWNPTNDTYSEILQLIGLKSFPRQPISNEENNGDLLLEVGECSICFSLRLNEKLPEIVCKNQYCDNCYHIECLYEWLISVNSRRFFSEIVGDCPNCEKNISCPIPE